MCGVPSMAAASACAGSTLSSNSTLAFFVFQSTETDLTPFTRDSPFCTVLVQGGQCSPVIRNVALVGGFAGSCATSLTTDVVDTVTNAIAITNVFCITFLLRDSENPHHDGVPSTPRAGNRIGKQTNTIAWYLLASR